MILRIQRLVIAGGLSLFAWGSLYSQDDPAEELAAPQGARAGTMDSRTSVSELPDSARFGEIEQVTVKGENPKARAMFLSYVRELRGDFRWSIYKSHQANQLISGRDAWEIPIRVELWGEVGDVYRGEDARMSVELRSDDRFHILLAARLHDKFEEEEFRLAAVRALIIEQMLTPFVPNPYALNVEKLVAPEWIVHGFDAMIEHRRTGQRSVFYSGVLKSGVFMTPDELFSEKDPLSLDPISYAIYRVSASAMVTALLDQEEGDLGMREFLGDLTLLAGSGEFSLLKKHFPAFREMDQGLDKWWTLQVATMGQRQRFEFLDRHETERWLTEVLTIGFNGEEEEERPPEKRKFFERFKKANQEDAPEGQFIGTIDQFSEFIDRKGAAEKLTQVLNNLQHVKVSGFPLYRPVFDRYELVINQLVQGDTKGASVELAALAQLRETIGNTLERSEDYLNHFEATQSPRRSDVFDDYMRMRKEFERRGNPVREDRITQYLDSLEREFR